MFLLTLPFFLVADPTPNFDLRQLLVICLHFINIEIMPYGIQCFVSMFTHQNNFQIHPYCVFASILFLCMAEQ